MSKLSCNVPPAHMPSLQYAMSRNQSWIFIGRTDAEAEAPNILATWLEALTHWKRPWCWERLKAGGDGATEDEMVGWHHWLNGHEFEQAPGICDGQGSLACCSPWCCKELDMSDWTIKFCVLWSLLKISFLYQILSIRSSESSSSGSVGLSGCQTVSADMEEVLGELGWVCHPNLRNPCLLICCYKKPIKVNKPPKTEV